MMRKGFTAFRPVLQLVQAGLFLAVSVFDLKLRLMPDRLNLAIALTALLAFTPLFSFFDKAEQLKAAIRILGSSLGKEPFLSLYGDWN